MRCMILMLVLTAAAVTASPFHAVETVIIGNKFDYQYPLLMQRDANQHGTCEDEANPGTFTAYDYAVVIGMLVISIGIGVFYGFFDKNSTGSAADFMLGTEMSIFPVTLSLTTSFITAIELLGNPAEIFFNGGQFALIVISMLMVIPLALYVFFPIYDKMKLTSCYEYLGMRFGKEMRVFGGSLYIIQMCFYTSVSVLAPAIALSKATGLNTRLAIVLIYVVCIFYSSQGGLKAVVIADTFQACVLFVSLIMILGVGTYMQEGGISAIFKIANENDRLELFNFDPNPTTRHTVFSVIIGGFFYWSSLLCVNQATVQKAMSLRNLSKAKVALTLSVFGLVLVFVMNFYTGFMTFAKYSTCDPFKAGKIDGIDQLIPFYVMETFGHLTTFVGIFVAGVFAASLGTVAACLSSLSAVTIEDLLINGINMKIPAEQGARYAKFMNLAYGVISFGLIFLVEGRGILQATLTLNGLVGGLLLGIFSLGVFFKRANSKGALYGGALSTVAVITLGVLALAYGDEEPFLESSVEGCSCTVNATAPVITGSSDDRPWYANIYNISYMWYSMVGCLLTVFFGLVISIAFDYIDERRIRKLTAKAGDEKIETFSSRTSQPPSRKASSASQKPSGYKVPSAFEGKLSEAASHAHHRYGSNDDRISIINEETLQAGQQQRPALSVIGVFDVHRHGIDNKGLDVSDERQRQQHS